MYGLMVGICVFSMIYSKTETLNYKIDGDRLTLTSQQIIEDYDMMWSQIEKEYPAMELAGRKSAKDFKEIKKQYRQNVVLCSSDRVFYNYIKLCLDEFEGYGHMRIFSTYDYTSAMARYKNEDIPAIKYLFNRIDNEKSRTAYSYKEDKFISQVNELSELALSNNLSTDILEEGKIALITISSFDTVFVEKDVPALHKFFQNIENYPYCILDLRGNLGGNTLYWRDGLVRPNINERKETQYSELIKGENCKDYYLAAGVSLQPIDQFSAKNFSRLNYNDLLDMKYFTTYQNIYDPMFDQPLFRGKFYVLTDSSNYSAADAFISFCKQTGFATIVGERTRGGGVGITPLIYVLPNSGICYQFSASMGLNKDASSNEEYGTFPDVICEGTDALKTCLDMIDRELR